MCQAIPRLVLAVKGDRAQVDVDGSPHWVKLSSACGEVAVRDYVHVYAGVAIERMEADEAREQLRFLQMLEERFPAGEEGP